MGDEFEERSNNTYFELVADFLANKFKLSPKVKEFVGQNSALIGDFAEAAVREFVAKTVKPLRVSTGAIISPRGFKNQIKARQIDTIIWRPNPFPAVAEAGNFALIPKESSFAVLEIKSSDYSGTDKSIQYIIDHEHELTTGPNSNRKYKSALGVIVLQKKLELKAPLQRQVEAGNTVVLLRQEGDEIIPNKDGINELVNFLSFHVRMREKAISAFVL